MKTTAPVSRYAFWLRFTTRFGAPTAQRDPKTQAPVTSNPKACAMAAALPVESGVAASAENCNSASCADAPSTAAHPMSGLIDWLARHNVTFMWGVGLAVLSVPADFAWLVNLIATILATAWIVAAAIVAKAKIKATKMASMCALLKSKA